MNHDYLTRMAGGLIMQNELISLLLIVLVLVGTFSAFKYFFAILPEPVTDVGNRPPEAAYTIAGHDGVAHVSIDGYILMVVDYRPDRKCREFDDVHRFDVREYTHWAKAHGYHAQTVDLHLVGCWCTDTLGSGTFYEPALLAYRNAVIYDH